ncbi:MAG: hypothetical protein ABR564_02685 [Candidatus Dormibacteria bacterium]
MPNHEAPDLVAVLLMPFGALMLCCALGLALYIAWGRRQRTH